MRDLKQHPLSAEFLKGKTKSQIAMMLVNEFPDYCVEMEKQMALRDEWLKNARSEFVPSEKKPCFVCGRYKDVAQAHHVVPLSKQDITKRADHRYMWLCPTHHAGVHLIINMSDGYPRLEGFSKEEGEKMADVAVLALMENSHA